MIEARGLSFSYPGGRPVFDGINFSFGKGEFVGILGANGSGKTTLLRILNRLLKPTAGEVYLEGIKAQTIHKDSYFARVCTMFQNPDDQLFSPTVREDISFGPRNMGLTEGEIDKRVDSAIDAVGMSELGEAAIHALSFGQKKRASLAGVLAMEPEVMLLDEPTSCLDPAGVSSIMGILKDLNRTKKITMVMATHSVDLVPIFIDRVIVLGEKKIILEGAPDEVFSEPDIIRACGLELPRIGHLFETLKKEDGLILNTLPLTIGQARQEITSRLTLKA